MIFSVRQIVLRKLVGMALRALTVINKRSEQTRAIVEGAALAGLSDESLSELTVELYDRAGTYKDDQSFEWEKTWLSRELPPPPGRLLIGGAGSGREVNLPALQGYEVFGFDPAERFVESATRRFAGRTDVKFVRASYENLVYETRPRARKVNELLDEFHPFDAVVLGWGSFTHIVGADARILLLRRLKRLCPSGPVLLSFWLRSEHDQARTPGRAGLLGAKFGRFIAGQSSSVRSPLKGDNVLPHCGYAHSFLMAEIEWLAGEAGYVVHIPSDSAEAAEYPHVTLRPSS